MSEEIKSYLTGRALPWTKQLINNWNASRGALQRITLRHLRSDGTPSSDVITVNVPAYTGPRDVPGPGEIEQLVEELIVGAMNDAEGLGSGLQRYGLFAFFEKEPMAPLRHPMKVQGGGLAARSGDEFGLGEVQDSETPDARGIAAQSMRHTEAMMKSTVFMSMQNQRIALEQNQMLANQVSTLIKQVFHLLESNQTILDNRTARELNEKKTKAWIDNMESFADMLKVLAPHAVNKIAGREILPARTTAAEIEITAVMQTLNPKQLEAMRQILKPEQLLSLVSIMERVMEKQGGKVVTDQTQAIEGAGPLVEYKVIPGLSAHLVAVIKEVGFDAETVDLETIKTDAPEKSIRAVEKKIRDNMPKSE